MNRMVTKIPGHSDNGVFTCPKCAKPVFFGDDPNDMFCPTCDHRFSLSGENRKPGKKKKGGSKKLYVYLGAVAVSLIIISTSAYYIWFDEAEQNLMSVYEAGNIRNLEPKEDVPPRTMSKDELRVYLEESLTEEVIKEIEREQTIYRSLFVVDEDFDMLNISMDSSVDNIAGFYDPDSKEMYVIGNHMTPYVNYILSHEYTHALQDQYFNLTNFIEGLSYDRHLARLSVAEGDASKVMNIYLSQMSMEDRLAMALDEMITLGMSYENYLDGGEGNRALSTLTMFPYIQGLSFVEKVHGDSGWTGVNDLYRYPPESTEQILHFDKFISREEPREINFELPLNGFDLEFEETLGEAFLAQMLDLHTNPGGDFDITSLMGMGSTSTEAKEAAAGWGGDSFFYYTSKDTPDGVSNLTSGDLSSDDDFLSVLSTTWDTVEDNLEFDALYDGMLNVLAEPETEDIHPVRGGYLYKYSSDLNTTVYYSNDKAIIDSVVEWQKEFQ